ncbi:hypothetical protein VPH35_071648 [Triticum aestivum]
MGIAAPPCQATTQHVSSTPKSSAAIYGGRPATASSMSHSQGFHQGSSGVYGFSSDGFDRPGSSQDHDQQQEQQHHVAQQSRRDKMRVQGFDPAAAAAHGLLPIDGDEHVEPGAMYDHAAAAGASNMLAEMFNFSAQTPSGPSATELLASQMNANYRFGFRQQAPGAVVAGLPGDGGWFGSGGPGRAGVVLGGANLLGETSSPKQQGGMAGLATDPAAAMQLFLMNPQQQQQSRSSPTSPPPSDAQSAIQHHEAFQAYGNAASSFGGGGAGVVEGQGLSLSLSPSLQQLEMAKQAEELRVRDGVLYFNRQQQQQQQAPSVQQLPMALHGQVGAMGQQLHVGYGPAGVAGVLRNSKYTRAAQELLDEFCSVGRGQTIKGGGRGAGGSSSNPNASKGGPSSSGAGQSPSSASREPPQLSPADRFEQQRKKAKLISMLDEARGSEVQPLLRPDADGGELLRLGDGVRGGDALHGAGAEGHVAALPVPQGRHRRAAAAHLRAAGREGRRHELRADQGGDTAAPRHRPEPPAAARLPPHGHDGAGGVAAPARPPRALRQHPPLLALRALPTPVPKRRR